MKRFLKSVSVLLVVLLILAACGGDANNSNNNNDDNANTGDKQEIAFWHAMSGDNGEALEAIVDKFNEDSDDIHIEAIYQGSYDDSLTKLRAVGGSDEAPAIVQVFEIGTKYMSESGFITPMQEFIDADDFDISQLEENILNYYTLDDELHSKIGRAHV